MMKYTDLLIHLIDFWYPEGAAFFLRTWKNTILFLEENLAVTLMWHLLFRPLFHDATIVGRVLSFLFRIIRIFWGLVAYFLATLLILAIATYWFLLPAMAVLDMPQFLSIGLFFLGIGFFVFHIATHPHLKIWSIRQAQDKQFTEDLWQASEIKKEQVNFKKLLAREEVIILLSYLELKIDHIPNWEIKDTEKLGRVAFELAKKSGSQYIGPAHFFVASLEEIPKIDNLLLKLDLSLADFRNALFYLEEKKQSQRMVNIWDDDFVIHHLQGINRGWLGAPTPVLDLHSEDLTKKAARGDFSDFNFIRSNKVLEDIINILSQKTGRSVLVVAQPGAGKSALIRHIAKQIVSGDAPEALATKRLVLLDLTKLLSGIKTQGDLADRIKQMFEEIEFSQNIIVVIEEIHDLGIGEAGSSLNLYSLLLPYIESDAFQFIASTEPENYSRILERVGSFARLFIKVELLPASLDDTIKILQSRSIAFESKNKVKITFLAQKLAAELAQKLIHDRVLPDSAISILKEAQTQPINGWVTKEVVKKVISSRIKVPLIETGSANRNKLLNLEDEIHLRMIDQEDAVKVVSDSLRRGATGLREEKRPIGSFLFVGPTGVGKTELAKILAESYFKDSSSFVRFDMSEYQTQESIQRLIGGNNEVGQLTEAIKSRPFALLLLDEFEKASMQILTLFLQVLEDGRLTDATGKLVDFTNTIIIATSNAASLTIAKGLEAGKNLDELKKGVNDELLAIFKPELINRFDDVVLFKPLSAQDLQKIVKLKLAQLQSQMRQKGYLLEFDDGLVEELAKKGYDPVLGARSLRRLLQDTLEARLSRMILENKLPKGEPVKVGVELLA